MTDETNVLEARDVTVRFNGQMVLRGFSMSLKAGRKAVLTGPSGCGKSTVLRCLLGFVTPESGTVLIDDTPLTAETVWNLRRRVAYVGQEPDLGGGVVREVLERPFHYRANASLRSNLQRAPEFLETFGLAPSLLDKEAGDLSGGEKQRVALVSALLLDRRIFLLDEITSALDPASKGAVAEYFRRRENVTVLFVAHDAERFSFADQVLSLRGPA
ncbi:MAG: ATP-binding cassette domain-containing protein [Sedimentisphaerales bacterium]|nr:ATP-binding cassette domain-containing protein [Sedimentisphaerales bacterium]